MLSRLPISLAQLKAGNNSEKLKNKVRQFFVSFKKIFNLKLYKKNYTWKNIKCVYNNNKFKNLKFQNFCFSLE